MGYRTQFWTSDESRPGALVFCEGDFGEAFLEVGGHTLPLFWSACFSAEHVNFGIVPVEERDHPEVTGVYGSFDAPRASVIRNLESRLASLEMLVPPEFHTLGRLFIEKLRSSTRTCVHCGLSDLIAPLDDDEALGVADSRKSWMEVLDGLDTPVRTVRSGLTRHILGSGIPKSWKHALFHASEDKPIFQAPPRSLTAWRAVGVDEADLRLWQA
jgi:hypothetical protein